MTLPGTFRGASSFERGCSLSLQRASPARQRTPSPGGSRLIARAQAVELQSPIGGELGEPLRSRQRSQQAPNLLELGHVVSWQCTRGAHGRSLGMRHVTRVAAARDVPPTDHRSNVLDCGKGRPVANHTHHATSKFIFSSPRRATTIPRAPADHGPILSHCGESARGSHDFFDGPSAQSSPRPSSHPALGVPK